MSQLTLEDLQSALSYDPDTGLFSRIAGTLPVATKLTKKGYLRLKVQGKMYMAHRLAWLYMTGKFPVVQIDHHDRIRHNNKWLNLREATNSQNQFNASTRKDNSSGHRGVSLCKKTGKWRVYIQNEKKWKHIGLFTDKDQAIQAFAKEAGKRGEFANV